MRRKLLSGAYIAIIAGLLALIGFSSCKKHRPVTKYGVPPIDRVDVQANAGIEAEKVE